MFTQQSATIASGASLSGAVDLGAFRVVGVIMPAAWTAAGVTFECAAELAVTGGNDPTVFVPVCDSAGTQFALTAAASKFIAVPDLFQCSSTIKVRSGTTAVGVNQGADRTIVLILAD